MSNTNDISLVRVIDGEPKTSSVIVADRTGNQHASVIRLVRDNISDFEKFGGVGFEIAPFETAGGMQKREVAHLNEQQATLLVTYLRNTPDVRRLKLALVSDFYAMRQQLQSQNVVALPSRSALAQMVLDAEKELGEAQSTIEAQKPIVSYHDKFVAERDDIITVDNFASQYGSTGPKVRSLIKEKGIAVRRAIGSRWSDTAGRMVEEFEWRPRQGVKSSEWFELRPQHNAPRLHNGQVRQTMYVLQFRADDLAAKLGLTEPQMFGGDAA